jgi:serine O-acetyltransferase
VPLETPSPCAPLESLKKDVAALRRSHSYPAGYGQWPDRFAPKALALIFPHFQEAHASGSLDFECAELRELLLSGIRSLHDRLPQSPEETADRFFECLSCVREALLEDATEMYDGDPAAESIDQVMFCYPGFYAIAVHRFAHALRKLGVPLLPRMLSEYAHRISGVDIHPGASIGRFFFIDHGTGIVIGETAVIGSHVKLYQGVTLGAHQVHKRLAGSKRHPTLEDGVVVYAHSTILGDIVIGANTVVGGNTWITRDVPPNSVVSSRNVITRAAEPPHVETSDFSI